MARFVDDWNEFVRDIEEGWLRTRRSDRVSLLPQFDESGRRRAIYLKFDVKPLDQQVGAARIRMVASSRGPFPVVTDSAGWKSITEAALQIVGEDTVCFDGLQFKFALTGHTFTLSRNPAGFDMRYEISLALTRASLSPVLAESTLRRFAQRNLSAAEAAEESHYFSATCGANMVVAQAGTGTAPSLSIVCESGQPGRDTTWAVTLRAGERFATEKKSASIQINHLPFIVSQLLEPDVSPEAGDILGQWKSDDAEGAQWRFGMDTVSLNLPPQAVGEAMVRGTRFRAPGDPVVPDVAKPIPYRFSRRTELQVRPSRLDRRYTVHPGDTLSILRDAELKYMVTELAYPLEVTYRHTPELLRTVIVSEVGTAMGQPAIALPEDNPASAMSALLVRYYNPERLAKAMRAQRQRHLAAKKSFMYRLAQFTLTDANFPRRRLDLREGLSARLRGASQGAGKVYPLPDGVPPAQVQFSGAEDFIDSPQAGRALPAGLLYSMEFASELAAVLRTPSTESVHLLDLTLSALGASGAMQAAFDEGRTVFDVKVENGQLSQLIKTRYGRIAAVWNKARHVVIYTRSTVPGVQFEAEQCAERFIGWPVLRKMEEYIEIVEPHRQFDQEGSAQQNKTGCLHAFHFATRQIHVNGAWGRDVGEGYEIPLFNVLDTSGFYIKPWMGPLAQGGAGALTQHWHDAPQHLFFYTSTEAGAGADTDQWAARRDIDCDSAVSFGAIAAHARTGDDTREMLAQRQVPSHTLQAAANPRFTMALRPDGLSNLVHGRGNEELVAAVSTMQIERSDTTSRVDLGMNSRIASAGLASAVAALSQTSRIGAEFRSVEATIRSLLSDAKQLWDLHKGENLERFRQTLKGQVERAFDEARARLAHGLENLPKQQGEAAAVVQKNFNLLQQLPDAMLDTVCAEGALAVADLRARLQRLAEHATDAAEVARRWPQIRDSYAVLPVRALLARAGTSIGSTCQFIDRLQKQLADTGADITSHSALLATALGMARSELAALLAALDPAGIKERATALLKNALKALHAHSAELLRLEGVIGTLKLPPDVNGLQHLRDGLLSALRLARRVSHSTAAFMEKKSTAIASLTALADLQDALRDGVADALDQADSAAQQLVTQAHVAVDKAGAALEALVLLLKQQEQLLLTGGSGALTRIFTDEAATFTTLVDAVTAATGDITTELHAFDAALLALERTLAPPAPGARCQLAVEASVAWRAYASDAETAVATVATALDTVSAAASTSLRGGAQAVLAELERRKLALCRLIDDVTTLPWADFAKEMEQGLSDVATELRERVLDQATRLVDQQTVDQLQAAAREVKEIIDKAKAGGEQLVLQAGAAFLPKAGPAIKLMKLLSDPPQLPQLTIRTDKIECVFDDLKDQVATSPFVARLRDLDAGIKELGLALPSSELLGNIVPDSLKGLDFSSVIRNAAIDFENFFKKFQLPDLPDGAIKISHHIDPGTRSAWVKADINHRFDSTESLFDISALSLDIRKPTLVASSNFNLAVNEPAKATTSARFSGDWILNLGGEKLVTFVGANIQYSESGGFKFDIDPKNIEPHSALKFIGDILKGAMPDIPENVEIVKNSAGIPVGAAITQNQAFGPWEAGGVAIGETVLASGFGLRIDEGRMKVDTSFSIGKKESPVFIQIGAYGGGGWLTARAWAAYVGGVLTPGYEASVGIALGSTKSFALAGVAQGSYALRLFVEAGFSTESNFFVAGLQLNGSARILGYLTAYLNLLVQVEHRSGGEMTGRGQLDISIKVCWCYTARISRAVNQTM